MELNLPCWPIQSLPPDLFTELGYSLCCKYCCQMLCVYRCDFIESPQHLYEAALVPSFYGRRTQDSKWTHSGFPG